MAKAIGVSKRTLGYYESGEREPGASVCVAISKLCSVSVDWLLKGVDTSRLKQAPENNQEAPLVPMEVSLIKSVIADNLELKIRLDYVASTVSVLREEMDTMKALKYANVQKKTGENYSAQQEKVA